MTAKFEAGLPNIIGNFTTQYSYGSYIASASGSNGALAWTVSTKSNLESGTGSRAQLNKLIFDASRSNDIYGAADTIQPPSIALIPQIRF